MSEEIKMLIGEEQLISRVKEIAEQILSLIHISEPTRR